MALTKSSPSLAKSHCLQPKLKAKKTQVSQATIKSGLFFLFRIDFKEKKKMPKKMDEYEMWEQTGQLPQVLNFIKDCSRKLTTQKEMCKHLNIDEKTFISLKKKYPIISATQIEAKIDLKKDLASAMYKKAIGHELINEEQYIEDGGKGKEQKRKIHRTKTQVSPDYKAIVYLLTKQFGIEYSDKNDEYELMECKLKEKWMEVGELPIEEETEEETDE